jgi:hypothetical protein
MITFRQFRSLVNAEVSRLSGLSLACLPDIDLSDYYDEEYTLAEAQDAAKEAAHMALLDEGFPADLLT